MRNSALGLIETYGFLGAVEAADTALKAAEVSILGLTKVKGGLVTITLTGEVSAMIAAVDAATAAVERLGVHRASHVIPRLDEEVWGILDEYEIEPKKPTPPKSPQGEPPKGKAQPQEKAEKPVPEKEVSRNEEKGRKAALSAMKVVELRRLARSMDGLKMEKGDIKYANKEMLLEALLQHEERRRKT